jgi:hypothetical protein
MTTEKFEILRNRTEELISRMVSDTIQEMFDNSFRDRIIDDLPNDWTGDDFDEVYKKFDDTDKEGGIDNTLYVNFIEDLVNSFMEKYK